jgi:hypothetical protein
MQGIPGLSDAKKTLWVAVKIFLLLLRESSVIWKAIFRKSEDTLSFFLQWRGEAYLEQEIGNA